MTEEHTELTMTNAIKLLHESPDFYHVGGYGHAWGGPGALADLVGDYFTPESDLWPDLVPVKAVLFGHALELTPDGDPFDFPIGKAAEASSFVDKIGKWINAQLDKRARYIDAVMEIIAAGKLAWSSGAVPHLVKRADDGWLKRWPVVEYTATTSPCEPRMTNIDRLKVAYKAAGLPELLLVEQGDANAEGHDVKALADAALALERERLRLILSR